MGRLLGFESLSYDCLSTTSRLMLAGSRIRLSTILTTSSRSKDLSLQDFRTGYEILQKLFTEVSISFDGWELMCWRPASRKHIIIQYQVHCFVHTFLFCHFQFLPQLSQRCLRSKCPLIASTSYYNHRWSIHRKIISMTKPNGKSLSCTPDQQTPPLTMFTQV